MKLKPSGPGRPALVWTAVAALVFAVSAFSVSAPEAFAQTGASQSEDAKRYSQLLQGIYQFILSNYVDEPDPAKLYEGAMKGMIDSLGDPHSVFLDEAMLSDMMEETEGSYAGVGLYISKQAGSLLTAPDGTPIPRYIEVVSPIEATPAWKEGIRPGDLLLEIDGESTAGMTVDQASSKIRGPEGTKVSLLFRRGASFEFKLEFVRAVIEIPAVKSSMILWQGSRIGYIRIIEWIPQTPQRVQAAIEALSAEGMESLLIDVRSNPGGLLTSVVDVSDLFLDSGMIVSTRGRNPGENEEFKAKPDLAMAKDRRMIVLQNRGSASASEIFAGAMKDSRRALLLGEKTYGKGSVQQVFPLDKTGFKLTMARYYTPSGINIDKTGIQPDISSPDIALGEEDLKVLERLFDSGKIETFAEANPGATVAERNAFAASLKEAGFALPETYLRRLVKDQLDRTKEIPVFDLEFDTQLNEALKAIVDPGFEARLAGAGTLSERITADAAAATPPAAAVAASAATKP